MAIRIVDWDREICSGKTDAAVGIKIATLLETNNEVFLTFLKSI